MKKLQMNRHDIIIIASFIFISIYILFYGYFGYLRITLDSIKYLRSAQSILDGNWLFYNASAGDSEYFRGAFPPGTALLIAAISFITSADVYVALIILSIISVLAIILMLRISFAAKSWFLVLSLFSLSFLKISSFAWSEKFFLVGILWFGISLVKVMQEDKPRKAHYISLFLASLFSFFIRFIGVFLIGVLGVFILLYLIKYYKSKDKRFSKKSMCLLMVALLSTILIGGYLLYNKTMTGYFTGVARIPAPESIFENAKSFIRAAKIEFENFFLLWLDGSVINAMLFALLLALLFYLKNIINYFKKTIHTNINKNKVTAAIFFVMGLIYMGILIILRFRNQFDPFNYRLLYCGTFLITLAILLFVLNDGLVKKINNSVGKKLCIIIGLFIVLSMALRIDMVKMTDIKAPYYKQMKNEVLYYYQDIKPKSLVVGQNETKLNVGFLRTDITTVGEPRFYNDYTNGKYDVYENIYLDTEVLNEYVKNIENIDEAEFYNQYLLTDDEFIKIK